MGEWHDYQCQVADFFRGLGLEVAVDESLSGVRTSHDIDVVVRSSHVGFAVTWIVECKQWRRPVTKLHVLALREIVQDLGADRGFLMAEGGFQRGAHESAFMTNVTLTSLADLTTTVGSELAIARVREFQLRLESLRLRYWSIDKETRIHLGLRPEVGQWGYSMRHRLDMVERALRDAVRGQFPLTPDPVFGGQELGLQAIDAAALSAEIEGELRDLEDRIEGAERQLAADDDNS